MNVACFICFVFVHIYPSLLLLVELNNRLSLAFLLTLNADRFAIARLAFPASLSLRAFSLSRSID